MPLDLLEADIQARRAALTGTDSCMLLRAGAGSGKTSVLAGRVVSLLAGGAEPASIAAISFTVLSASELLERVTRFIDAVLSDDIPPDLAPAFPDGSASPEQKELLLQARGSLDELTCSTIHGFCGALLRPYPVEAVFDPGARPMDSAEADLLFGEVFDEWLRQRLEKAAEGDLVLSLYMSRPNAVLSALNDIAKEIRARPDCEARECGPLSRTDETFQAAVAEFRAFVATRGEAHCPPQLLEVVRGLEERAAEYPATAPESALIGWLMNLSAPEACAKGDGDFLSSKSVTSLGAWKAVLGGGKAMDAEVREANNQSADCYNACIAAHTAMIEAAAPRVLHVFCEEARTMVTAYAARKREAAVLDFDDLIQATRTLLRARPDVRKDLGNRFRHVLVDEFQDTDPAQVELLWRLCGEPPEGAPDAPWSEWRLRPGSIFLVGDPKQAIYRFRGADLRSFHQALDLIQRTPGSQVLDISRNFRSRDGILSWVNKRFATVFGRPGQADRGDLLTAVEDALGTAAVVALPLDVEPKSVTKAGKPTFSIEEVRDAEAEAVALLCTRLIGHHQVRDRRAPGGVRLCQPRDIALLTPGGTKLWRYEMALEKRKLTVAAQAGKGFYRRQEVQDLIALTRVLADRQDTLALGALLRGPLIGATDEQLLDVVADQPPRDDGTFPSISLGMDVSRAAPVLQAVLPLLNLLARDKRTSTPHALMSRAVELLRVRAILRERGGKTAERALANVDLFLEQAKPFSLRGIKAFAEHVTQAWEDGEKALDGRPDADRHSITLMTMHASKGLEWPVVIAVNQNGEAKDIGSSARDTDGLFHKSILGLSSEECREALEAEKLERTFERERLWYVAATRARDLLVLPLLPGASDKAWINIVNVHADPLPTHDADHEPTEVERPVDGANLQDAATFNAEAQVVVSAIPRIQRLTPHLAEVGEEKAETLILTEAGEDAVTARQIGGGFRRGLCLHKLLEERLTGEIGSSSEEMEQRAAELLGQLGSDGPGAPSPVEVAASAARALAAPEIAAILPRLVPEWPVAVSINLEGVENIVSGFADAAEVLEDGTVETVVDWKSDASPSAATVSQYTAQVGTYIRALGARRGLLVFATTGQIVEVLPPGLSA